MPPDRANKSKAFQPPSRTGASSKTIKSKSDKKSTQGGGTTSSRRGGKKSGTAPRTGTIENDDDDSSEDEAMNEDEDVSDLASNALDLTPAEGSSGGGDDDDDDEDMIDGKEGQDDTEDEEGDDEDVNMFSAARENSTKPVRGRRRRSDSATAINNSNKDRGKDGDGPKQQIPAKLLRALLQHHFRDGEMRVNAEASLLVGKYLETFVREAIARAVFERAEVAGERRKGTGASGDDETEIETAQGDRFVQVEDLEKLAPQLLLDF